MTFLSTLSAWQWTLAVAVPVGIAALYFLRLRRKPIEIPSTMLWRKSIEDLHVNAFWQRLRRNLLLLLQLLAAAALLLALARPAWNATDTGKRCILLIDNSASMSSSDAQPTRLDEAKAKAIEVIEQLGSSDEAMVMKFAADARIVASWTREKTVLRKAVASIEQTGLPTRLSEAMAMIAGIASASADKDDANGNSKTAGGDEARTRVKVYVLSDGRVEGPSDLQIADVDVAFVRTGRSGENIGVMDLAVATNNRDGSTREVFARVRNFGAQPVQASAELRIDGKPIDLRRVDAPAGGQLGVVFPVTEQGGRQLSLHLSPGGDFAMDDVAFATISEIDPVKVLRIGPDNPVLDAAFETEAIQSFAAIESLPATEVDRDIEGGAYDLVIFDRCGPASMPPANTWFIGEAPQSIKSALTEATTPTILDWKSSHPVLRFLNLDDVNVYRAALANKDAPVQPLIETDQGSLLFISARGVYSDLILTAAVIDAAGAWQTDWPLKPSFPLFVMNVIRSQGGVREEAARSTRTGEPVSLRVPVDAATAVLIPPDGGNLPIEPVAPGRIEVVDANRPGIYQLQAGPMTQTFAVNLFNETESTIAPADRITIDSQAVADSTLRIQTRREWWKWLALAALGLLLVEWYIYNRRVYV